MKASSGTLSTGTECRARRPSRTRNAGSSQGAQNDHERAWRLPNYGQAGRGKLGPDPPTLPLGQDGQRREPQAPDHRRVIYLERDRAEEDVADHEALDHRHE